MLRLGLRPEEAAPSVQLSGYYTTGNAAILAGRVYIIVYLARASRQGWQRSQYC